MCDAIVGFVIGVVREFAAEFEAHRREDAVPARHRRKCQSWETGVEESRELIVGVRHARTVSTLGCASVRKCTLSSTQPPQPPRSWRGVWATSVSVPPARVTMSPLRAAPVTAVRKVRGQPRDYWCG
jgi:hypothetical protein